MVGAIVRANRLKTRRRVPEGTGEFSLRELAVLSLATQLFSEHSNTTQHSPRETTTETNPYGTTYGQHASDHKALAAHTMWPHSTAYGTPSSQRPLPRSGYAWPDLGGPLNATLSTHPVIITRARMPRVITLLV